MLEHVAALRQHQRMGTKSRTILAKNLKRLMKSGRGPSSQNQLWHASGVSQATISDIMLKKAAAGIDTVEALAKPYGLTSSQLLDPNLALPQ